MSLVESADDPPDSGKGVILERDANSSQSISSSVRWRTISVSVSGIHLMRPRGQGQEKEGEIRHRSTPDPKLPLLATGGARATRREFGECSGRPSVANSLG